jgi:hypothetical protein
MVVLIIQLAKRLVKMCLAKNALREKDSEKKVYKKG